MLAAASLTLMLTHGFTQAAVLAVGDKIGIDFGPTLTTNWNNITTANQTIAAGSAVRIGGDILDGVTIVTSNTQFVNNDGSDNWVGLQSNPTIIQGPKAPAEFVDSVTTDIAGNFNLGDDNPYTITISGLNNSFTYNLVTVAAAGAFGSNIDTVTVNGGTGQGFIRSTAVADGLFTSFTGLTTDGSGNLIIRVTDTSVGTNPIINGALLTAVPEPSAAVLGGLGMLALLRRRR